jgi:hypothetical protein
MDTHITRGDRMQPFYVVIHYLAEISQSAVHYIFANFKMISNIRMKPEIFDRNLHVAMGEHLSFVRMWWIAS